MRRLLFAIALPALLAGPALAEPPSPVRTAELSARLYAMGLDLGDPLMILSAARLRKSINPTQGTSLPEGGGASDGEGPLGWEEMLASADAMAEGDDALQGLIADLRAESTKGVTSGPVYNIGTLGSGASDIYPPVDFMGGDYAEVYVEAMTATDLNLEVFDAQGRLVCADTDKSHIAYCGWRPAESGGYVLKVRNDGPMGAKYALMTN